MCKGIVYVHKIQYLCIVKLKNLIVMEDIKKKAKKWVKKATKTRLKLKDEAYTIMDELIRNYGTDEGENIVINLVEHDNTITVMEHNDFDGGYIARDIERIELSKECGGISLIYGEDDYDYIKYSNVMFSDRIFIIDELMYIFK